MWLPMKRNKHKNKEKKLKRRKKKRKKVSTVVDFARGLHWDSPPVSLAQGHPSRVGESSFGGREGLGARGPLSAI